MKRTPKSQKSPRSRFNLTAVMSMSSLIIVKRKTGLRHAIIIFSLLLSSTAGIWGQSSFVPLGDHGAALDFSVEFEESGFYRFYGNIGYSIGGFIDLGLSAGYSLPSPGSWTRTESLFSLVYRVSILKQSANMPVSFELGGSFGVSNGSSVRDSLTVFREGTGYTLQARGYRQFSFSPVFSLFFGVSAR